MCTGLKGSQDSHKLHMQSTSFATRSAFFMRLNLLPRQGGWCHLRCSWTAGIGLSCHYRWAQVSHKSCVTSSSLNSPLKWLRTSPMGRRQPCMDKWVSPHPSSHKSHVPLSQSVSEGVPRPWGALLSRYPLKSGSYHLRKKNNQTDKSTSETQMDFLHSFLSAQSFPFLLPHFCGKMSLKSSPDLTFSNPFISWLPSWNQPRIFPFPFISPSISYLDFPFLHMYQDYGYILLFFNSLRVGGLICSMILSTVVTGIVGASIFPNMALVRFLKKKR